MIEIVVNINIIIDNITISVRMRNDKEI